MYAPHPAWDIPIWGRTENGLNSSEDNLKKSLPDIIDSEEGREMKRSNFFAYAIWLVVFFFLAGMSAGAERGIQVKRIDDFSHESGKLGEYRALIIGINDYKGSRIPDLETPINDATAIAKVLKEKYGFKIQLLLDREATREAIYKGLRSLAASSKPNDSVLIYFAGHGDLDRTYDD